MRLTLDAGNTHVSAALLRRGKVERHLVLPIGIGERLLERKLREWLGRDRSRVASAAFASVVPGETEKLREAIARLTGRAPRRFPSELPARLRILPRPATRIGADRLANALGALALPETIRAGAAIVADVGTAVTVDLVTTLPSVGAVGVFCGGMIAPGPRIAARALSESTAQLPRVEFAPARTPIGRSTRQAIGAGLWFGFRGLVRALVEEARAASPGAVVVVAGGDGARCLRDSGLRILEHPELTHLGLDRALELASEPS